MSRVSDGQIWRVQLLIGLLQPVFTLLLDEVTTDLDVVARADLHTFLRDETGDARRRPALRHPRPRRAGGLGHAPGLARRWHASAGSVLMAELTELADLRRARRGLTII